jgi:hypothetical protein
VLELETGAGITTINFYAGFQTRANRIRDDLIAFLIRARQEGKKIGAYGAAAKGNTLLNYCGPKAAEHIAYVVDRSPYKQGLFLPGSHRPIVCEDRLKVDKPDYVMIFPWNLRDEIAEQLAYIRQWGARFVVCVPDLKVW